MAAMCPLPLIWSSCSCSWSSVTRSAVRSSWVSTAKDCSACSGRAGCWPSQASSSRGAVRSILVRPCTAGPAAFMVPSNAAVPPGRVTATVAGLLPPAAAAPAWATEPVIVARLPSNVAPPAISSGWSTALCPIVSASCSTRRLCPDILSS